MARRMVRLVSAVIVVLPTQHSHITLPDPLGKLKSLDNH